MAIHRSTDADGFTVTFVLVDKDAAGPVSVVGSFNDWTPGAHPFEDNPDGSRSVTIVLPIESDVYFRYLGPEGYWFDDPDADEVTAEGSILRAPSDETSTESTSETVDDPTSPPVASSDEVPAVDTDRQSTLEENQPEAHDETGERLQTVTDRIDDAKRAAHELADHDLIHAAAPNEADARDETDAHDDTVEASGDEAPGPTSAASGPVGSGDRQ